MEIRNDVLLNKIEEFFNIHGRTLSESYETEIIEDIQPNIVIKPSSYTVEPRILRERNNPKYDLLLPFVYRLPRSRRPEFSIVIGKRVSYGYLVTGSLMIGGGRIKAVPTASLLNAFPQLRQR